jgi:hypothetical protein
MTSRTNIKLLPKSSENYISFDYGCLRFLDSYKHLSDSLDEISKSMEDKDFHICWEFIDEKLASKTNREVLFKLLRHKIPFPHDYIKSFEVFKERKLPPIEAFYSELKQEGISLKEYLRAQLIWKICRCKTLEDYSNIYSMMDPLLLGDCMEHYRDVNIKDHGLDPCHTYSLPGFTIEAGLQMCEKVWNENHPENDQWNLQLLTDIEMHEMFEKAKRGGFSGVLGDRHVVANNKYLDEYDPDKPSRYILNIDANNLYGGPLSKKLP